MLTASGSALVSGASPSPMEKTTQVKVLRAFLLKTERQEVGKVIEVSRTLAMELASANKVEILKAKEVAAAAVQDLKAEPPKKGKSNAGQ